MVRATTTEARAEGYKAASVLWADVNFQELWVKAIKADLQQFKNALWELNFDDLPPEHLKMWTEHLGLSIPKSGEDYKLALACLRSIVKYTEWRLETVKTGSDRFSEYQQFLVERSRQEAEGGRK